MSRRSRPTLAEIAAAGGVSVPTVSKVVNGRSDVAAGTRRRIEGLLRDHGYVPRRGRPDSPVGLIDLVFVDLGSPWVMQILIGVEEAAHRAGVGIVVSAIHGRYRSGPDRRWLENLSERRSDGVLLVLSELSPARQALLDGLGVPVVVVDPAGGLPATGVPAAGLPGEGHRGGGLPASGVPAVGAANWAGGLAATEHLIGLGHERIAVVTGPPHVLCSRARVDGYRAAMSTADLPVPAGYVRTGDLLGPAGYRETHALLDLPEPPTAVFYCADQMALGAYEALYERGLRVPDDLSVVGFDDLAEARWAVPPLSTVRQPLTEMAGMAARMLLTLIDGQRLDTTRVELVTPLVVRASSASPRAD